MKISCALCFVTSVTALFGLGERGANLVVLCSTQQKIIRDSKKNKFVFYFHTNKFLNVIFVWLLEAAENPFYRSNIGDRCKFVIATPTLSPLSCSLLELEIAKE